VPFPFGHLAQSGREARHVVECHHTRYRTSGRSPRRRLEGAVAFPKLFSRFTQLTPAGTPARRETLLLRGFDTLPVTVR
jgi:hypothetical protein